MSKVLFFISPTLNSFFDKRKGTTGNKIDCATKHFANAIVTHTAAGAAIAGVGLAGKIAMKNSAELANAGSIKKAFKYLEAAPKPIKIIGAAIAGFAALLYSYKAGRIEQKYLDRAQFVDHTFKLDGEGAKIVQKK